MRYGMYARSRGDAKYPKLWDRLAVALPFYLGPTFFNANTANPASYTVYPNYAGPGRRACRIGTHGEIKSRMELRRQASSSWSSDYFEAKSGNWAHCFGVGSGTNNERLEYYSRLGGSSTPMVTTSDRINEASLMFDIQMLSNSPSANQTGLANIASGVPFRTHYPWTDGQVYSDLLLGTGRHTCGSNTGFDKSQRHTLIVTHKFDGGSNNYNIYQNGSLYYSTTGQSANLGWWNTMRVGSSDPSYSGQGWWFRAYLWMRILDGSEIRRFSSRNMDFDPYTPRESVAGLSVAAPVTSSSMLMGCPF